MIYCTTASHYQSHPEEHVETPAAKKKMKMSTTGGHQEEAIAICSMDGYVELFTYATDALAG